MNRDQEYLLSPSMRSLLLFIWSLIFAVIGWNYYLLGDYSGVLLLLVSMPLWLLHALLLLIRQGDARLLWLEILCVCLMVMPVLYLWHLAPERTAPSVMVLPVVTFFLLPERVWHRVMSILLLSILVVSWSPLSAESSVALGSEVCIGIETGLYTLAMSALLLIGRITLRSEQRRRVARSLRDPLSSACNARFLRDSLKREVARCTISGGHISLIGLAIDEYQQLQQSHSRHEQRELYQGIVRQIRSRIRRVDEVFRLENDVWVVMLPDCREDAELVLREALSRQLEEAEWEHVQQLSLTASGVTLMSGEESEELLKRLTVRLSKQKQGHVQAAAFHL